MQEMESYKDDPFPAQSPIVQLKLKRLKKAAAPTSKARTPDAIPSLSDSPKVPDLDGSTTISSFSGSEPSPSDADLDPLFVPLKLPEGSKFQDMEGEDEDIEAAMHILENEGKKKSAKKRLILDDEEEADAIPSLSDSPKVPDLDGSDAISSFSGSKPSASNADLDPLFAPPQLPKGSEFQDLEGEDEYRVAAMHVGGNEGKKSAKKRLILDGNEGKKSAKKQLILDGNEGKKSAKKRPILDDEEEIPKGKKKKSRSSNPRPKESIREKKRLEKERKATLDQIHVESQRLLRETRDASFKPMPLVQKPISSVLEKIRLRKLEVLKRSSILYQSDSVDNVDSLSAEVVLNSNPSKTQRNMKEIESTRMDAYSDLPLNDGENHRLDDKADDTSEILPPTMPMSSSKLAPADISSSEEDLEKENIDPYPYKAVKMDLYPKGGPAKAFVDDEAEEEDDSDHDKMRFQENDDDDETDEDEVLDDLVVTGFEEAPTDHEKRNQLHQKWLEQQDATETDNMLQRLKGGIKQREPELLYGEHDEEYSEDSKDGTFCDLPSFNGVQKNSKKAKQMIAQMFNDGNDVYVPSDDEETEQTLIRQRIFKEIEEPSFISPLEDENSREVFGLIKKLNIAPDSKKRGRISTSSFDMLTVGGSSNSSSKLSFVGRTGNSLSSSHKQGSSTVRTFIFGRDDSNSRSIISTSDNVPDMGQKEDQPSKTMASKLSSSSSLPKTCVKSKGEMKSGSSSSLFDILRQSSSSSSMRYEKQSVDKDGSSSSTFVITESQVAYQFSAFKLGKKFSKVESRN